MKLKIIEERCIACGACQMIAPKTFEVYDVAKILSEPKNESEKETAGYAIIACPTQAIQKINELKKVLSK